MKCQTGDLFLKQSITDLWEIIQHPSQYFGCWWVFAFLYSISSLQMFGINMLIFFIIFLFS